MSIDNLRAALPEWAKDLSLNISTLARGTSLSDEQQWGTMLACAAATRNEFVISEIAAEAREHLSEEAFNGALAASAIMGMNNVLYRGRHILGGNYASIRPNLRMNVIAKSGGTAKINFEMWSMAVSLINNCEACSKAHEATVRAEGATEEQVIDVLRISSVIAGIGQAITAARAL